MKFTKRNIAVSIAAVMLSFSLIISMSPSHASAYNLQKAVLHERSYAAEYFVESNGSGLTKQKDLWDVVEPDTSSITVKVKKITLEAVEAEEQEFNPIILTDKDYDALCRIVQAEAGNEDLKGKVLVANVVLNRYASEKFPDTVYDVVTQKHYGASGRLIYQFSPARPGASFWYVNPSEETLEAVSLALNGVDYSQGALYFVARKRANTNSMSWFDRNLTWLFKHGNHEFYA